MITREIGRFFRRSPLLSISGVMILGFGFGLSALAIAMLLALSSLRRPGLADRSYATIAEETMGGGSARISWNRVTQLEHALPPHVFLAAYTEAAQVTLKTRNTSLATRASGASSELFSTFTHALVAGRDFYPSENSDPNSRSVIISYSLAVQLFGTPSVAIGNIVKIDGSAFEVVGVAPMGFSGLFANTEADSVSLWVPPSCFLAFIGTLPDPSMPKDLWKDIALFYGIASSEYATSSELDTELERSLPLTSTGESRLHVSQGLTLDPERDNRMRRYFRLGLLIAIVFTVIVSLNYSLILLARAPQLAGETSLRTAFGASLLDIVVELLTGPLAMAGASMVVASGIAVLGMRVIPSYFSLYQQVMLNSARYITEALAIELLFAILLTLLSSSLPILSVIVNRRAPIGSHHMTHSRLLGHLIQIPIALQIALCMCVWTLASMILASFLAQLQTSPGYVPSGLTVIQGGQTTESLTGGGRGDSFPPARSIHAVLDELKAIPGVSNVSFTTSAPMDGQPSPAITVEGLDNSTAGTPHTAYVEWVGANYFSTMRSRILEGHGFTTLNGSNGHEVILNEVLARELWPGEHAVNRSIRLLYPAMSGMAPRQEMVTVASVVETMRGFGATGPSLSPMLFFSADGGRFFTTAPEFVVRGNTSAALVYEAAGRRIRTLIPGLDAVSSYSLADRLEESLHPEKTRAEVAIAASLIMIFLTLLGLYGSLLYFVLTHSREFAIRLCLGSSWWQLRVIVLKRAMSCIVAAIILSLPFWFVLSGLSSDEFLGRVSWSTVRAGVITALCALVCLGISLVAARTVSQVAPAEMLKQE